MKFEFNSPSYIQNLIELPLNSNIFPKIRKDDFKNNLKTVANSCLNNYQSYPLYSDIQTDSKYNSQGISQNDKNKYLNNKINLIVLLKILQNF